MSINLNGAFSDATDDTAAFAAGDVISLTSHFEEPDAAADTPHHDNVFELKAVVGATSLHALKLALLSNMDSDVVTNPNEKSKTAEAGRGLRRRFGDAIVADIMFQQTLLSENRRLSGNSGNSSNRTLSYTNISNSARNHNDNKRKENEGEIDTLQQVLAAQMLLLGFLNKQSLEMQARIVEYEREVKSINKSVTDLNVLLKTYSQGVEENNAEIMQNRKIMASAYGEYSRAYRTYDRIANEFSEKMTNSKVCMTVTRNPDGSLSIGPFNLDEALVARHISQEDYTKIHDAEIAMRDAEARIEELENANREKTDHNEALEAMEGHITEQLNTLRARRTELMDKIQKEKGSLTELKGSIATLEAKIAETQTALNTRIELREQIEAVDEYIKSGQMTERAKLFMTDRLTVREFLHGKEGLEGFDKPLPEYMIEHLKKEYGEAFSERFMDKKLSEFSATLRAEKEANDPSKILTEQNLTGTITGAAPEPEPRPDTGLESPLPPPRNDSMS